LGSNTIISLIKGFIPQKVRIPSFIVIIATFVTIVDLLIHAFFPPLHKALGIFIPLIVVNCIILARAEAFASKNTVLLSVVDALGMGAGFTAALLLLGGAREVLGSGTFFGMKVGTFSPALVMILPPGAFLLLGLYLSFFNWMGARR
jgi:electron transport complex protein RnfE